MDSAKYMVISKQDTLFEKMAVIANNVANANSTGFKAEMAYHQQHKMHNKSGVHTRLDSSFDFRQGPMQRTGRDLDVAIDGEGFFVVQTQLGKRYTRAGNFRLDTEGALVTPEGHRVQSLGGPIIFTETDTDVKINNQGVITVNVNGVREERGTLSVVKFNNLKGMKKAGNSLYSTNEAPRPAEPAVDFNIAQSSIEGSNVNSVKQMTEMIDVNRSTGTTGRFLNDIHELQRRTISTLTSRRN